MMALRTLRATNAALGTSLLGAIFVITCVAIFWTPMDPLAMNLESKLHPPSLTHLFGTDEYGRDVLSRAMSGAITSTSISVVTVVLSIIFGVIIGALSGFIGGWTDRILMMVNDATLAFPGILWGLAVMVVVGPSRVGVIAALTFAYTPAVVRVVRGTVLSVREKEFVQASRMIGNSEWQTLRRHVLPNCIGPVAVLASSMLGWVLLSESALSFLGLGVPPPTATWGNMLSSARSFMQTAVWLGLVPGSFIVVTLLGTNLIGDFLRDRFDPRMQGS
jgi:peptide/nickel transport system permease protein